jgi:hypothetical protein
MSRHATLIVPATVPGATVTPVPTAAPAPPVLSTIAPSVVPLAQAVPVVPGQLTAEQVDLLGDDSDGQREELDAIHRR